MTGYALKPLAWGLLFDTTTSAQCAGLPPMDVVGTARVGQTCVRVGHVHPSHLSP